MAGISCAFTEYGNGADLWLHRMPILSWRACRGVFGCHTALVLRRLHRLCAREYGRQPRFIVASATIANPREHIQSLLGALPT